MNLLKKNSQLQIILHNIIFQVMSLTGKVGECTGRLCFLHPHDLAPVVQTLDSATHRINHYPADKYYGNQIRYPLDSDLSSG